MKRISAIDLVAQAHGCSRSEAKRLLKEGAVALGEPGCVYIADMRIIRVDEVFEFEDNTH